MHPCRLNLQIFVCKCLFAVGFVLLFAGAWAGAAGQKLREPLPVQIDSGKVLGVATADGKVIAYKGIPYAAPPLADLRWQPPHPVAKWKKVLFARDFGSHCIQFGGYPDMVFHDPGPSEDCLTLNVWIPTDVKLAKKSSGLPVMVWIYGGGYQTGGTSENRQDGQFLARRGVVVVSMNYRLGIFGFMTHTELTAESPHHASGNYGLMDQAAAIAWVGRNIWAFGGDPGNITIFGESAGSMSVSAQMASPVAKGMFAKAIGESGSEFAGARALAPLREPEEQATAAWAERVFGTSRLFYLRNLTTDELVKAAMANSRPAPPQFGPVIDGYFLPDSVERIYATGGQAHVPLLAGWNRDEGLINVLNARPPVTAASFRAQAQSEFGAGATRFLTLYPASTDAEALRSAGDLSGDRFIAFSTWRWIEAQVKTGSAPVYRYFFALGSPGDDNHAAKMGAFHSDDIEYVFGTLDSRPGVVLRPEDRKLSEQMGEYWVNFAKTGDPNGVGASGAAAGGTSLPKWPVYGAAGGWQVMHLDAAPQAWPDSYRDRYLFLDSVWGKAAGR